MEKAIIFILVLEVKISSNKHSPPPPKLLSFLFKYNLLSLLYNNKHMSVNFFVI